MTCTDNVERLLLVLQDYFAVLLEAFDLDFDYLTYAFSVVFDVLDAVVVLDNPRNAKVEATEHNLLLNVLDESLDVCINAQSCHVFDIPVDERVPNALSGVAQDLVVELCCTLVYLAALSDVVDDLLVEDVHASHFLVNLW